MSVPAAIMGSLISGIFGQSSANSANQLTKEHAQNQYRWAANDMEKAGLNRILALGGPASMGHPASAQMPDLGNTANSAKKVQLEQNKNEAEIDVLKSQAELNRANAKWGGLASPGRLLDHIIPDLSGIGERHSKMQKATKGMSGGQSRKYRRNHK